MIYQDQTYAPISPAVKERLGKAMQYLAKTNFAALEDGACEIDGKNIYVLLQSFHVEEGIDAAFETHRAYIDVQYVIEGRLDLCVTPATGFSWMAPTMGKTTLCFISGGRMKRYCGSTLAIWLFCFRKTPTAMVCAPAPGAPVYIRKCVIKVRT